MAIDSANKRGSLFRLLPIPESGVDAGDRAQLVGLYRGFFDEESIVEPPTISPSTSAVDEDPDVMTLLEIIQTVAPEIKLPVPGYVIGNPDSNAQLLLSMAKREMWLEMTEFVWPQLVKELTITLVSGTAAYAFANDHDRQLFETHWDRTQHWPLLGPVSPQEWQEIKSGTITSFPRRRFRIKGYADGQIFVDPTPSAGDAGATLIMEYVSRTCIRPRKWAESITFAAGAFCFWNGNIYYTTSGGTTGTTEPTHTSGTASDGSIAWTFYDEAYDIFRADTDVPLIDNHVLCAGIIWRWRRANGFDYEDEKREWQDLIKRRYVAKKGAKTIQLAPRAQFYFLSPLNVPDTGYGST